MKSVLLSLQQLFQSEKWPQSLCRQLLWAAAGAGLLLSPMRSSILLPKLGLATAALLGMKWLRNGRRFRQDCITAGAALTLLYLLFLKSRMDHCICWSVVLLLALAMAESRTAFLHGKSGFAALCLLAEAAAALLFLCSGWRGVYLLLAPWYALALWSVLFISCGRSLTRKGK